MFQYKDGKNWSSLPTDVVEPPSTETFGTQLDTAVSNLL